MKNFIYYIIHSLCCLLYRKEYKRYTKKQSPEEVQEAIRREILSKNRETLYGKRYGFDECDSLEAFRNKVPLTIYEDYLPYIEMIKEGEKQVLTQEDILMLELTSGSSSAKKYIPYTKSLKEEFQKGIKPWLYHLYQNIPQIKWGRSYWSITPVTARREYTKSGIPIGFEEDSEYFGKIEKHLMNQIIITPKDVVHETDMEKFYFKTMKTLLEEKNLTLISIWSPTLLLLLLEYLHHHEDELLDKLSERRKRIIEKAVQERDYKMIWRKLAVISCWTDGNSSAYADKLKELFPHVIIQPKGLLATEGMISFPFVGEEGARISYRSHYFEFRSLKDDNFYSIEKLTIGEEYEVIMTTGGGLYRYCLKDVIAVCGYRDKIPLVKFVGKKDKVSDLFGEKLNELFVIKQFSSIFDAEDFYMLAPDKDRYVLYVQTKKSYKEEEIDQLLRENYHYDYCRSLNQLKPLKIYRLNNNPKEEYIKACLKKGQRLGDIKLCTLSNEDGWEKVFY